MNKQPTISKLISGGEGIVDLNVSETLTAKKLSVTGSDFANIPNLYVSSHLAVYDGTTNSNVDLVPYIDANNQNIANLQRATTNITYSDGGYTNIPNLYIGNDLLLYDSSTGSNIDVVPTLDTIKTNTTNISYTNSKTNIPDLYVTNSLTLYDTTHAEDIDVVSTLNSLSRKTSNITVDGSGKMNIVELLVTNKLSVYDPVGGNKDIIYTLDSQQDQITTNSSDIKAINTKLNNTVSNSSLTTSLSGYALATDLQATNTTLTNNYPTHSVLDEELTHYATRSLLTTSLNDFVKTSSLTSILSDYPPNSVVEDALTNYVTNDSFTTTIGKYALQSSLNNTNSAFNTLKDDLGKVGIKFNNLSSLGTLVPIGGIPTPISSIPLSYINNIDDQTVNGIITFTQDPSFSALSIAEANISTNTNNIATNTSNIATNTNNITTNTINIATNTSSINNLNSQMTSTTGSINNLNSQMSTANNNISSNTTSINNLNSQMNTVNSNISTNTNNITSLQQQMLQPFTVPLSSSIYADNDQLIAMTSTQLFYAYDGWYCTNSALGKKINWYYPCGLTYGQIQAIYFNCYLLSKTATPAITIYTNLKSSGNAGSFYNARINLDCGSGYTGNIGKICFTGNVNGTYTPSVPNHTNYSLTLEGTSNGLSQGTPLASDTIYAIAFTTNSASSANQNSFI